MLAKKIVPIRPTSHTELLEFLEKIGSRADLVEIWLDRFPIDEKLPRQWEFLGKCGEKSDAEKFLKLGGAFVDMDLKNITEQKIKKIPHQNLWISFHDYASLPEYLEKTFEAMKRHKPFGYKFSVTVNDEKSLKKFLEFIKNFPEKTPAIFATMGDLGLEGREKIREMKKSWGEFFALDENSRTASGQPILP